MDSQVILLKDKMYWYIVIQNNIDLINQISMVLKELLVMRDIPMQFKLEVNYTQNAIYINTGRYTHTHILST